MALTEGLRKDATASIASDLEKMDEMIALNVIALVRLIFTRCSVADWPMAI